MYAKRIEGEFEYVKVGNRDFRINIPLRTQILTLLRTLRLKDMSMPELVSQVKGFDERQQANFVTLIVGMEQLTDSEVLWSKAVELAQQEPTLFDPKYVAETFKPVGCVPSATYCAECTRDCSIRILAAKLKVLHRMNSVMSTRWLSNSIMLGKYDYDARKVVQNIKVNMLQQRMELDRVGRYQWQGLKADKIFCFWVRTMFDWKFWDIDITYFDIPVDVHIARFPFRTRMLDSLETMPLHIRKDRELIQYFYRAGIGAPLEYDSIVWTISRNYCIACSAKCSLYNLCGKNFEIDLSDYGTLHLKKKEIPWMTVKK